MRVTKAQAEARVNDLLRILLDGAEPGWDLCEFVRDQEREEGSCWYVGEGGKPLSYSQIRRYAAKAEKLIARSCRTSRKQLLRQHQAMRRSLYAKAVSQGDVRAAAAVLKDLAELQGLYPAKNVALTGKDGKPMVLNIIEQVVGRTAGGDQLGGIVEEVVTHASGTSRPDHKDGPPAPGTAGLPRQ
jgi:hypothetical protein